MRSRDVVATLLFVVACRGPVWAQSPAMVEVASGDRIAGDVRHLERARLAFRTVAASTPGAQRWAGTISIVWTEVVTLTSTQDLTIELSSGERFSGTISSPAPRQLVVQTASGPTRPLEMREIVRITRIEATFLARVTGSLDFGLNVTTAADVRTYALNGEAAHRAGPYESDLTVSSWLSQQEDADTQTRHDVGFDMRRFFPGRWFALATFGAQHDDELGLDLRLLAGGGIGRRLVQSNRTVLSVQGGLDYDGEWYEDVGDVTDHSVEAFAGVEWDWFADGSALEAALEATTFVSLERERVRLELESMLRRDLFGDTYWAVNVFESFDSDPPSDRERSNFGVSLTLGWSF